jgi:hypothetical protein
MGEVIELTQKDWTFLKKVQGSIKWSLSQEDPSKYRRAIEMEERIKRDRIRKIHGYCE